MNLVKNEMKIKLVNRLGAVISIFAARATGMLSAFPILELKAEAATTEMIAEYAKMDTP